MLALALVFLGVALRLVPHLANFAPIGALALFGGVYLNKRYALFLPIAALIVSDAIIGFDSLESRLTVYGSFLLIGIIGLYVRRKKNVATIAAGTIAGSVIFYLITNFAYFYPPDMYAHNLSGIASSYYYALPFFRNTLLGDLFYTGLLFGMYETALYLAQRAKITDKFSIV